MRPSQCGSGLRPPIANSRDDETSDLNDGHRGDRDEVQDEPRQTHAREDRGGNG